MQSERRKHPRVNIPLEGAYYLDRSGWGRRAVRVVDLSEGGCFIDALSPPPVGASLVVEMTLGGCAVAIPSEVVYIDRVQGFAVRFMDVPADAQTALAELLDGLRRAKRSA